MPKKKPTPKWQCKSTIQSSVTFKIIMPMFEYVFMLLIYKYVLFWGISDFELKSKNLEKFTSNRAKKVTVVNQSSPTPIPT